MKKVLASVIVVLGILLTTYAFLGGFKPLQFEIRSFQQLVLMGQPYEGDATSKQMQELFTDIKAMALAYNRELVIVSFDDGADEEDARLFVGIPWKETALKGYTALEIRGGQRCSVELAGHPMVLPSVQKVQQKARMHIAEMGLQPADQSLERYRPDGTISVEVLVR